MFDVVVTAVVFWSSLLQKYTFFCDPQETNQFHQGFVSGSGTRIPRGWIRIRIGTPLKLFSTLFSYGSTRFGRVILFAFCFSMLKSQATLWIGLSATTFKNVCSSTPCVHTNSCLKCNLPKEFSCPSVCHNFLKEGGGSYTFGALVTI